MTAEEILRSRERSALENNQLVSHVTGKQAALNGKGKKGSLGALAFVTAMLVVFAVLFSSGNLIPSAISERLIEETDVQYADAVESKKRVFQQAMHNGDLPENTVEILKQNGVETERAENGEIDAGAIVGPALRHGVLARDDAVAKDPFEPVNLVGVERQESHKVDGIADRHRNRVRDGIGREGHRRNGIRESFGILEGVIKGEYDGMVVPEPDVFHNGRFP